MTADQRRRAMADRLPEILEKFYLDIRTSPGSLNLPASSANYLKSLAGSSDQASMGGGDSGIPMPPSEIAAGLSEFKKTQGGKSVAFTTRGGAFMDSGGPSRYAMFPAETEIATAAEQAALLRQSSQADPSVRPQFDAAKESMSGAALRMIEQMRSTPANKYRWNDWPVDLKNANIGGGMSREDLGRSLYEIRPDGVYYLSGPAGARKFDTAMTGRYWTAKALVGYSPEEVKNRRTFEGMSLSDTHLDPTEYLYFQTAGEFTKAVAEYTESVGKSGIIAEVMLPASGVSFAEFRANQLRLLHDRKPLMTKE